MVWTLTLYQLCPDVSQSFKSISMLDTNVRTSHEPKKGLGLWNTLESSRSCWPLVVVKYKAGNHSQTDFCYLLATRKDVQDHIDNYMIINALFKHRLQELLNLSNTYNSIYPGCWKMADLHFRATYELCEWAFLKKHMLARRTAS